MSDPSRHSVRSFAVPNEDLPGFRSKGTGGSRLLVPISEGARLWHLSQQFEARLLQLDLLAQRRHDLASPLLLPFQV